MMDTLLKVILPAGRIPDKATVTKPTGTAEFTLTREIRIFPNKDAGKRSSLDAKDGCVFLIGKGATDVNVYPPTSQLAWLVDIETLHAYLDPFVNPYKYEDK